MRISKEALFKGVSTLILLGHDPLKSASFEIRISSFGLWSINPSVD